MRVARHTLVRVRILTRRLLKAIGARFVQNDPWRKTSPNIVEDPFILVLAALVVDISKFVGDVQTTILAILICAPDLHTFFSPNTPPWYEEEDKGKKAQNERPLWWPIMLDPLYLDARFQSRLYYRQSSIKDKETTR